MSMHRGVAAVVCAIALSAFPVPPASAAASAGGACAKPGLTSIALGKKFTCVKSGKKLVWNKGVAVAKPAAPAADYYAKFKGRGPVYKVMDSLIAEMTTKTVYTGSKPTTYLEDPSDPWNAQVITIIERAADRWRVLSPALPTPTIVIAKTDPWLRKTTDAVCPRLYDGTVWGGAAAQCETFIGFYTPLVKTWDAKTMPMAPAHEAFHAAQWDRSHTKNWNWEPNWFQEGSGNVMGTISVAMDNVGTHYDSYVGNDNYSRYDCADVLARWEANANVTVQDIDHNSTNHCEYGLGRMMVEYLLAQRPNLKGLLDIYTDNANGITFSDSLKQHFGLTLPEFYPAFRKYLDTVDW